MKKEVQIEDFLLIDFLFFSFLRDCCVIDGVRYSSISRYVGECGGRIRR